MFRIVKRTGLTKLQSFALRFAAIILALVASALFIRLLGHNPLKVYGSMIDGAIGSEYRRKQVLIQTILLTITSLGIAIAFKMKFWNIGAEGQLFMGAFAASFFALNYPDMPKPLLLIVMAVAGIIAGGIWALIPAFFKAQFGTNETLFTLMLNYIALKWVTYLQYSLWSDPARKGFPIIPKFSENAILPKVFGVHIGWIIAIVLVVIVHIYIHYSKSGYEISVIGESENTARYAGMNVKKVIISAIFLSGAICGLAGMIQASAVNKTLSIDLTAGAGFTAITVTWLAQLNAFVIVVVSFLFASMVQGGSFIQSQFQISQSVASIIQGVILFFVLGSEFFLNYKIVFKGFLVNKKTEKEGV